MQSPIVKEEKVDIKQGLLNLPSDDRLFPSFKRWKQRYFVFCQIRKGKNNWLKLFFYKSQSTHKEGNMPKGFIDITNASDIGIMDKDVDGHSHIIYINTPGKAYHLSASSCEERSQWLLAIRAYKYDDKSKLPSSLERAQSWNGWKGYQRHLDKRKFSEPASGTYTGANGSRHKLMEMYLVCPKCNDQYVSKEVYTWVRPENSDIYKAIHSSLHGNSSISESVYELPRGQVDDASFGSNTTAPENSEQRILSQTENNIRTREPLPLPVPIRSYGNGRGSIEESLTTCSSISSEGDRGKISKSRFASYCRTACANEEANSMSPSPGSHSSEEYIVMDGRKNKRDLAFKRSSLPCRLSSTHNSNGPLFFLSPEGPPSVKSSLSAGFDEVFSEQQLPPKRMIPPESSTPHLNVEDNKYTPEPIVIGGLRQSQGNKDYNDTSKNSVVASGGSLQARLSDIKEVCSERQKRNSVTVGLSKFLQSKYGVEGPMFVTDL